MTSTKRVRWMGAMAAVGVLALTAAEAQAAGFQLAEQSARGLGRAFAGGAAMAEDASTIFFNPAGLTMMSGHQLSETVSWIVPSGKYRDFRSQDVFGNALTGGNGQDGGSGVLVPAFYAAFSINENWKAGLGINTPFGLSTNFPDDWKGRYSATDSEIVTINVQPTVAYRIDEQWSVGVGLNYQHIEAVLGNQVNLATLAIAGLGPAPAAALGFSPQGNDGEVEVTGDDASWGWNAGVLYQHDEKTRIGLAFRSKIAHVLDGDADFKTPPEAGTLIAATGALVDSDVEARVTLPETASLSVVHDFDDKWTFSADGSWTRWSRLDQLDVVFDNPNQPTNTLELGWDDTWKVAVGADYKYNDDWTFRAGLALDNSPLKEALRSPRVPANDRRWTSFGFTYRFDEHTLLDFAYSFIYVKAGRVDTTSSTGDNLVGKFDNHVHILAVGATYDF